MKHLKKLSVVLMMTALFSLTFTSCIDNEVSPLVEAIYGAQADLIAAQAAVQNAEATKLEAEAAYQLALAAQGNANAALTLEEVEELKIANAAAQILVDEAQAEFNVYLVELLAQLEEANAQIALDYALKYRLYANAATDLLDDKADAVYDLAYAQAQADSSFPLYAIQALETLVANAQYQVEINEDRIAALQALIDDPNSLPAQVTAWEKRLAELEDLRDLKQAEVDAKYFEAENLIAGWDGQDDVRDNFVQEYEDQAQKVADLSADILVFQTDIDGLEADILTYDADLAAAEAALAAAQTAYDDAVAAEAVAETNSDAADALEVAELGELTLIQNDIADLYVSLQDAITLLAALEAGEAPLLATKAAADAALLVAQAAQIVAQGEYDLRKANFEANPAGITWLDGTDTPPMFETPLVGNHNDALLTSYVEVLTWDNNGVDDNTPATWQMVTSATYPADGGGQTYVVYSGAITDAQAVDANYHVFLEVEADDTSDTNANLLNIEVADLDAAKVVTAAAQADVDAAQDALDTYAEDLLAAQEDYLYKKGLYEDGVAIEAIAQAEYDAAVAAAVAAQAVETAAEALVISTDADLTDAQDDLDDLEACDAACLQDAIDVAQHSIDLIQPSLDLAIALVAQMQAQYDIYMETYIPGSSTNYDNLDADLKVQYDTLMHAAFLLNQELDALDAEYDYVDDMLDYNSGWNLSAVSLEIEFELLYYTFQGSYLDSLNDLEDAENALAAAVAGNTYDAAYIEYLQSVVDVLDQRYENALALAAKYKALMEAALAS